MGKGIIIPFLIISMSSIVFVLSHNYYTMIPDHRDIEMVIGFALMAAFMPIILATCLPVLLMPYVVGIKWGIFVIIMSLIAASFLVYYVSRQEWAIREHEALRIGIILFSAIITNSSIALSTRIKD